MHILATGEVGVKACAQLNEGRNAAVHMDLALAGGHHPGDELQGRALAAAVPSHNPQGFAPVDGEADVTQGVERRRPAAALEQGRQELPQGAALLQLKPLAYVDELYRLVVR